MIEKLLTELENYYDVDYSLKDGILRLQYGDVREKLNLNGWSIIYQVKMIMDSEVVEEALR